MGGGGGGYIILPWKLFLSRRSSTATQQSSRSFFFSSSLLLASPASLFKNWTRFAARSTPAWEVNGDAKNDTCLAQAHGFSMHMISRPYPKARDCTTTQTQTVTKIIEIFWPQHPRERADSSLRTTRQSESIAKLIPKTLLYVTEIR